MHIFSKGYWEVKAIGEYSTESIPKMDTIALDGMATEMFSQNEYCCKYASVSQIQDVIFAM